MWLGVGRPLPWLCGRSQRLGTDMGMLAMGCEALGPLDPPSSWKRSGGEPAGSCRDAITGSMFAKTAAVAPMAATSMWGVSGKMIGLKADPFFSSW